MVLRIYTEEWHDIVERLGNSALTKRPSCLHYEVHFVEVDGQSQFDPSALGKKRGKFWKRQDMHQRTGYVQLWVFTRTQTDPQHYLVFDLREECGKPRDPVGISVFTFFWLSRVSIRLEWKIGSFSRHFFVDPDTAHLLQQPPLNQLGLDSHPDNMARWLRGAVGEAAKFIDAQKRVLEEHCAPMSGLDPDFLLPAWKRTRLGLLLNLLGVS